MSIVSLTSSSFQIQSICVAEASEFELSVVSTKAQAWETIALEKAEQKSNEQEIFQDAADLSCGLYTCIKQRAFETIERSYFLLSTDIVGKIQAIALSHIFFDHIKVAALTTHPHNIRSPLNESEAGRAFGAATAIITHLKKIMNQKPSLEKIVVDAVDSSIGFYQKMGFQLQSTIEEASGQKLSKRMVFLRENMAISNSLS